MRFPGSLPARGLSVLLPGLLGIALQTARAEADPGWEPARPPRPVDCRRLPPAGGWAASLAEGGVFCLEPGTYPGPVRLDRPVHLWGPVEAVVQSDGRGNTIEVRAPGTVLEGFTVDGSGRRLEELSTAVHIVADDVRAEGLTVRNALFGLLIEKANRIAVRGCRVDGAGEGPMGLRGDAIRLWEVRDSVIEGNRVLDSRDLVVWYSPRNRIVGNRIERSRYGTHFMYSHDNEVRDNLYLANVVGVFVMYSRHLSIRGNGFLKSGGAAGIGLGVKESGNLTVTDNRLLFNTVGVYLDTTPLNLDDHNRFESNEIGYGDTGVLFHSSPHRNRFLANRLHDNHAPVRVEGGGDALDIEWRGNDFDDYVGYDLDGDGIGDVPYRLRSFSNQLESLHPDLAFFHGSATLALVDAASRLLPLLEPRLVLVDEAPRTGPAAEGPSHAD